MAAEGTHLSLNEGMEKGELDIIGENEEFYETIEAPKFVDFNIPDNFRPDDRYWFCSRVGCDQKHEEEMDSEAIYRSFVLRVMAARSPNVRLHKALNRNSSSKTMKCPLSAPPKSSKSRLSRLAVISSVSLKMMDDKQERVKVVKPVSKLCSSTPKAKGKQVAAKYLTTPRNKKCTADPNGFRSVQIQNAKSPPGGIVVPKTRAVAKALTFPSPKKAFNLKSSVELKTPLTKLCQKMKKLEITSQRKPAQSVNNDSKRKTPQKMISGQSKQDAESLKGKNTGKLSKQTSKKKVCFANETAAEESRDGKCLEDPILNGQSSNSPRTNVAADENPILPTSFKEEDDENEMTHNDDKENATAYDENRSFIHKNDHSGRAILGIQNSDRRNATEAVDKDRKAQAMSGAPGLKMVKLKPTNPKPFKLRTDERGILREANLERKNNAIASQKEANLMGQQHLDHQKGIAGLKPTKKKVKAKTPNANKERNPNQEELKSTTPTCESNVSKKKKSPSSCALQPQRHLFVTPEAAIPETTINATKSTSSGNTKLKGTGKQCKKVNRLPAGSSSQGRRAVTVPREPNFQKSQKSCAGKTS